MSENPDLEGMLKNIPSEKDKSLTDEEKPPFYELEPSFYINDPKKSIEMWEHAFELYPEQRKSNLDKFGQTYELANRPRDAVALYEEGLAENPGSDYYAVLAAEVYYKMWEFEKAEEILKQAIRDDPNNLANYWNLSRYYNQSDEFDSRELSKYPEYESSYKKPPETNLDKAIKILENGLKRVPEKNWEYDFDRIYADLAKRYTEAGDSYNAIKYAKTLVDGLEKHYEKFGGDMYSGSASYYLVESLRNLGDIYNKFENHSEGIKAYEKAHSLLDEPNRYDWKHLGKGYAEAGRYNKAESALNKIKDERDRKGDLAHMFFNKKDYIKAAQLFESIGDPRGLAPCERYYNAGLAYYNCNDYPNARRIFRDIVNRGVIHKNSAQEILDEMEEW